MKKYKIFLLAFFLILFVNNNYVFASETTHFRGKIIEINKQFEDNSHIYQEIKIRLNDGTIVETINDSKLTGRKTLYKINDALVMQKVESPEGPVHIITDYNRLPTLFILFCVFTITALLVGRKSGLFSIIGMFFSFLVIFKVILPQIIAGRNPMLATVFGSLLIIPVTFYLSHGFNKKTHVAIVSTLIVLTFTTLFTGIVVALSKLTGYSSDEAMFLQIGSNMVNMRGILISGIIIGFLGVLDDVTISQSSLVIQLKKANPSFDFLELYKRGMSVGRDHISSMINTLFLVYAGASMPLLLIFINNPQPLFTVFNAELIAEEIVRTLLGSIGLILAVPISTVIASFVNEN